MKYPKYITGGLFLLSENKGKAIYKRPILTGNWSLTVEWVDGNLTCVDCVAHYLVGCIYNSITEDDFIQENGKGRYSLKQLLPVNK